MIKNAHRLCGVLFFLAVLLPTSMSHAETRREYVHKYVLLIDWVTRSELWVTQNFADLTLCRFAHSIAEHHVELARRMTPPTEFVSIHPHLLLIIENTERMFEYASHGNRTEFRRHQRIVHDEQRTISDLLQAEGHLMPVISP